MPKHALAIPLSLKEDDLLFEKAPTQTDESQKNIILRGTHYEYILSEFREIRPELPID